MRTVADIREIEAFLGQEAHLLDDRRYEDWMELFTEDGFYWAPSTPEQEDPFSNVSLIYDDREAMRTRITRLRHPRAHFQVPHSRTARLVTNPYPEETLGSDAAILVRSKFLLYEYRPSIPEAFERIVAGTYFHRLVPYGRQFKIAWKKVVLVNCDGAFAPIASYF